MERITEFTVSVFIIGGTDSKKMPSVAEQTVVSPVGCGRAHRYHRKIVNKEHYCGEYRKSEPAVCDNFIDLVGG